MTSCLKSFNGFALQRKNKSETPHFSRSVVTITCTGHTRAIPGHLQRPNKALGRWGTAPQQPAVTVWTDWVRSRPPSSEPSLLQPPPLGTQLQPHRLLLPPQGLGSCCPPHRRYLSSPPTWLFLLPRVSAAQEGLPITLSQGASFTLYLTIRSDICLITGSLSPQEKKGFEAISQHLLRTKRRALTKVQYLTNICEIN